MATLTVNESSTPAEVQAFLAQIASQNPDIAIIKKEIRSKNPAGCTRVFAPTLLLIMSVVAINQIRQFGTLFIASNLNPLWEQTQAFQAKNANSSWHYFGMMLIEHTLSAINPFSSNSWLTRPPICQTMYIYDPAYPNFGVNGPLPLAPNQFHQIGQFSNLNMARTMIREIRTAGGFSGHHIHPHWRRGQRERHKQFLSQERGLAGSGCTGMAEKKDLADSRIALG